MGALPAIIPATDALARHEKRVDRLRGKIEKTTTELGALIEQRPALALAAEEGGATEQRKLQTLNRSIEHAANRRSELADALTAAEREYEAASAKRAAEDAAERLAHGRILCDKRLEIASRMQEKFAGVAADKAELDEITRQIWELIGSGPGFEHHTAPFNSEKVHAAIYNCGVKVGLAWLFKIHGAEMEKSFFAAKPSITEAFDAQNREALANAADAKRDDEDDSS